MIKIAKFNIGDFVTHQHLGYKAVIIDVDPIFQASGRYNPQAFKREFATRNPWYRLLVDNSKQVTYVEECLLIKDTSKEKQDHPEIHQYLIETLGSYHHVSAKHH